MAKKDVNIDVTITSNKAAYEQALEQAAERILTMIGMQVESAAKRLCPVDTGLLRNSITFALAGEGANETQYKASTGDGKGSYSGSMPDDKKHEHTVHVGTNVEYAMAQELGEFKGKPHAFLRPAVNDNIDRFRKIVEQELKKELNNI